MGRSAQQRTLWCIISPVFKPAPGGGAIYSDTLARQLAMAGCDVDVWVEKHPGELEHESLAVGPGEAAIHRVFPHRAGRTRMDVSSYVAFAAANFEYFKLPRLIRKYSESGYSKVRILLHSSFLYKPTIFPLLLGRLRDTGVADTRLVLDVRDYGMPEPARKLLSRFDRIVTSSEGVAGFLARDDLTLPILMPFEQPENTPDAAGIAQSLAKFGLEGKKFLLNPNGISLAKHIDAMRGSIPLLRRHQGFENVVLVNAGRERDRSNADSASEERGESLYVGSLGREDLHALMVSGMFTLVLSDREAISRSALEAMALGGRVILPDLPEFRRECADFVLSDISAEGLAGKIVAMQHEPMPPYRFELHEAREYLPRYLSI
jgi:hypothetical protein